MSTIEFIEKEPYELNTLWVKEKYFPCYMLKDGIELFVWNRSEPSDRFDNEDLELRKQQLICNGGAYFKFFDHSSHISPLDFLSWVSEHKLTLHEDTNAELLSDGKTFDFLGNLNECSCAFFYRIFDRNIMKEVLKKSIRLHKARTCLDSEQLKRLHDVFLFKEKKVICTAWFEPSGKLCIEYDSPSGKGVYEPMLDDAEGEKKIDYILVGNSADKQM